MIRLADLAWCLLIASVSTALASPRGDLNSLHERIHKLQKDLSETEGSRNQAQEELRKTERNISEINRRLRDLARQQQSLQSELENLYQRSSDTQEALTQNQSALAALLREHYAESFTLADDPWLAGPDFDERVRHEHWLEALAGDQADNGKHLESNLQNLAQVTSAREKKYKQLLRVQVEQAEQRKRLEAENKTRVRLVAELSSRLNQQKRSLDSLRRDERRLTRLVEELERKLAARRSSSRRHQHGAGKATGSEPPVAMINQLPEPGEDNGGFSHLRGHLRLPLAGELMNRFGTPRQDTGLLWKGLFIRAPEGRDVKAVASGRVVFADWLRGFGNLLIIDHGNGYMSLYGGAQSLLAQVGDLVHGGATVASAGSTGGSSESGIYFELRYESRPFDPLSWTGQP